MRGSIAVRLATAIIATGLAVVAGATTATAAPQQTACGSSTGVGTICVTQRDNGYDVSFKNGGTYSMVDFNLNTSSGTYGDNGAFWSQPGQYNTYFFAVGYKTTARVCLYSRDYKFAPFCSSYLYN